MCDKVEGEKTHLKYAKFVLGVKNKSSNHGCRGELGEFPILINQIILSIKYFIRINTMPVDSLVYKCLQECKHLTGNNSSTWLNGLRNIFTHCNEIPNWNKLMNGDSVNVKMLCSSIERKMKKMYENQWLAKINKTSINGTEGNKLRTYCKFKKQFNLENYLLSSNSKSERSLFSKLRVSAHRLRIETGRHVRPKIEVDKRYCTYCNDFSIEDEKHFILDCKLYADERKNFLLKLKNILPGICISNSESLFNIVLSCYNGDTEVCGVVLQYVRQCMNKRE